MPKYQPIGTGMVPSTTNIGGFIRSRRIRFGLSQTELAHKVGVAHSTVGVIERGERKYLTSEQVERFAGALKCNPDALRKRMPAKPRPQTALGRLIQSRRQELGLSIETFAEQMHMTTAQARRWEMSKSAGLRYQRVVLLQEVLNLSRTDIIPFLRTRKESTRSPLGRLIQSRRQELGISMKELGKGLGVTRQRVHQMETQQNCLSDNTIRTIANILGLQVEQLELLKPRKKRVIRVPRESASPLGTSLAQKRMERGLTQEQLAAKAGLNVSTVRATEQGWYKPHSRTLRELERALGVFSQSSG